jgi:uncharacterized protein YidB (DUF937 family)
MSGMLGQILGGLLGGGGQQGQQSPIAGILEQVLATKDANGNTGIAAIVSRFQSAGASQQVQSWVGTGSNEPVSPDQVGQAFGDGQIEAWAKQAGTTPDAMRQVLSEAVPHVVDHMTPAGQVPTQNANLAGLLQGLLGNLGGTRQA